MDSHQVLLLVLGIVVFEFLLERVLGVFNIRNLKPELPKAFSDVYGQEEYAKSLRYQKANYRFGLFSASISFVVTFVVLALGWLGKANTFLTAGIESPIVSALVFFGAMFIVNDLLSLPFSLYRTFSIEEKFGFNRMTLKTFLLDKLKSYALTGILGGGILALLMYLLGVLGKDYWWAFWIFLSVVLPLFNLLYTNVIMPIFNKFTPLEDGELREAIMDYAKKVDFPLEGIYVMDGSKRSTKANAFFSGFGRFKRIVLFDTLIEKLETEELVAVLAHEVGHYKKKHILQGMVISILQTGLLLFLSSLFVFNPLFSEALGSEGMNVLYLNLMAFGLLFGPISMIVSVGFNLLSRKNEYQADAWAVRTFGAEPMVGALKKLTAKNFGNLTPHSAYVFFHYSHPPLWQRLEAIESVK
ncbi:peptidase M48 [Fulvitalea axinellae]|uniref:Peptidase M48 n=1 Tax=Fulvitalea axinellae TaxID=1182444 RepID=A0AAU9CAS2_9BACT|nr:peptidase M48 [Fulvitalea axinellae]